MKRISWAMVFGGVITLASVARAEDDKIVLADEDNKAWSPGSGRRIPIGAYGEILAEFQGKKRALNTKRLVLFLGNDFGKKIRFYSEIEFEGEFDKTAASQIKVSIEQAYLEWEWHNAVGLRAGLVLVPMGIINTYHEPPIFHGVNRPEVDKFILPTTWRELGLGFFGALGGNVRYQWYVVAGLDGSKFTGENGIRKGRQGEAKVNFRDVATTGRLEWSGVLGLTLGTGFYYGTVAQDDAKLAHVQLAIAEAAAMFQRSGFEARAVYALTWLKNAKAINDAYTLTDTKANGERGYGGYLEVAYDVLRLFTTTDHQLLPFVRWEIFNTQEQAASAADTSATAKQSFTYGLTYRPIPKVVFKADFRKLTAGTGEKDLAFNLGVAFMY